MERFFNMCRMHEIDLWEIKKEQNVCMCEAYATDFLKMPPLLKKTGNKSARSQKEGTAVLLSFYKKKDYFFCGRSIMLNYVELCDKICLGN